MEKEMTEKKEKAENGFIDLNDCNYILDKNDKIVLLYTASKLPGSIGECYIEETRFKSVTKDSYAFFHKTTEGFLRYTPEKIKDYDNLIIYTVRKPEPELIIKKSGGTWVARYKGIDYLIIDPHRFELIGRMTMTTDVGVNELIEKKIIKSISEIEITDEIGNIHPFVIDESTGSSLEALLAVINNTVYTSDGDCSLNKFKKIYQKEKYSILNYDKYMRIFNSREINIKDTEFGKQPHVISKISIDINDEYKKEIIITWNYIAIKRKNMGGD